MNTQQSNQSIKAYLERSRTSMGLKTSHRERLESVSELVVALEKERQMEQVMMKSVEQWTEIVDEITTSMDAATPNESEWKTRCHYQRLFNQMLSQEIGHIKTELYMLRQGHAGMTLPVMGHAQSKSPRSSQCRESQAYISSLEEKLKSLESLYNMYEHQRDDASRDYHRLKEEINMIAKDVMFKQKTRIKRQEDSDQKEIATKIPETVTLPPLKGQRGREKTSYLKLHEVKSVTCKPIDRGRNQTWKGVGKLSTLPPIDNAKHNGKNENVSSKKTKSTYVVQEKWKRVTKKDVLPPIWSDKIDNREEDNKSKIPGKGQVKENKKPFGDFKLPSMRMRRITNLTTDSGGLSLPAVRKGRVYDGCRETEAGSSVNKVRQAIHTDYVGHVDDQRAGSTDDLAQSEKGTGHNTDNPVGERSEIHCESQTSSTKTTIKSTLRKSERTVSTEENESVSNKSHHKKKVRSKSKGTKKSLPEVVASPPECDASEHHEYQLHVDSIEPTSKPPTKRLKSAFVRSSSKGSNEDGRKTNVSPSELGISPTGQESQLSVVYREAMSPLNVTTDDMV